MSIVEAIGKRLGITREQVLDLIASATVEIREREGFAIEYDVEVPPSYVDGGIVRYLPSSGREFALCIIAGERDLVATIGRAAQDVIAGELRQEIDRRNRNGGTR